MPHIDLHAYPLEPYERETLRSLLDGREEAELSLSQLWSLLDQTWYEFGCSNERPDWSRVQSYYRHPVWLLNGMFVEADPASMQHRRAIASWIALRTGRDAIERVLDFGGGFATLATLIADASERLHVDILEPHPTRVGQLRVAQHPRVSFVSHLHQQAPWDCLVSTDVLEHVSDPLQTLCDMRAAVRPGGHLLLANNFEPVIQCHLPATFYLRSTFELFALCLGLVRIGRIEGSHAVIYRRTQAALLKADDLRVLEDLSRKTSPLLDGARRTLQSLRARIRAGADA